MEPLLLVEDKTDRRTMLARHGRAGYAVDEAPDERRAIHKFAREIPHGRSRFEDAKGLRDWTLLLRDFKPCGRAIPLLAADGEDPWKSRKPR